MKKIAGICSICFLIACGSKTTDKNNTQGNINGGIDSTKTKTEVIDDARPSPLKRTTGFIDGVKTIIQWGSPSVKGREIWGMIVPYDEVWRTGANEATTVEFDKDVLVNDKELKAGKYGFFSIPREGEWTIIFNSVWNQWGAFEYDEKKDAARFNIKPDSSELSETMEYGIDADGFYMTWEKIKIKIKVKAK
jgi:hypothetical protein